MNEATGRIWMAGERMEILVDADCIQRCEHDIAHNLPKVIGRLCGTLKRKDVARHIIRNIRIGDSVALVDHRSGFAFRLEMDVHAIRVIGIYEQQAYPKEPASQAIYLLRNSLLWAVPGKGVAA